MSIRLLPQCHHCLRCSVTVQYLNFFLLWSIIELLFTHHMSACCPHRRCSPRRRARPAAGGSGRAGASASCWAWPACTWTCLLSGQRTEHCEHGDTENHSLYHYYNHTETDMWKDGSRLNEWRHRCSFITSQERKVPADQVHSTGCSDTPGLVACRWPSPDTRGCMCHLLGEMSDILVSWKQS